MALDLEIHFHYLHRIKNRWSAVSCPLLGFKVQKEFPSELRTAWFCTVACLLLLRILFISLDLQIEVLFNGRFQGQAGPPQVDVSRHWHWRKSEVRHSKDGLGLRLPGAPFGNFWVSLGTGIDFAIEKHVTNCFQSTVSAFQGLCRDRFW